MQNFTKIKRTGLRELSRSIVECVDSELPVALLTDVIDGERDDVRLSGEHVGVVGVQLLRHHTHTVRPAGTEGRSRGLLSGSPCTRRVGFANGSASTRTINDVNSSRSVSVTKNKSIDTTWHQHQISWNFDVYWAYKSPFIFAWQTALSEQ